MLSRGAPLFLFSVILVLVAAVGSCADLDEKKTTLYINSFLGKGSFGKVYLVTDQTGQRHALKRIRTKGRNAVKIAREAVAMRLMASCPYSVHMHKLLVDRHSFMFASDYCQFGDLKRYYVLVLEAKWTFHAEIMNRILLHILSALQCLHEHNLQHCDIKPSNILISKTDYQDGGAIKFVLADYGLCTEEVIKREHNGDCMYHSFDILSQKYGADQPEDLWRLAVTIVALSIGITKAPDRFPPKQYPPDGHGTCSAALRIVREKVMVHRASRLTAKDILEMYSGELADQLSDEAALRQQTEMLSNILSGTMDDLMTIKHKYGDNGALEDVKRTIQAFKVDIPMERVQLRIISSTS